MNQKRIIYFDVLNVISCIAVVAMHVNGTAVNTFSYDKKWLVSLFVEVISYFAVPVFFMLTGATLIDYRKRYSTREFAAKRAKRTVVPFVVWSLFAILWCTFALHIFEWKELMNPIKVLDIIINVRAFNIYYFFPNLFAVYLCIPVLSLIADDRRIKIFEYMILYSFLTISVLPLMFGYLGIGWNHDLTNPMTGGYILYVLIGYILSKVDLKKTQRYIIYALGIMGAFIQYIMTIILSYKDGAMNYTFRGYLNFPTVLYASAVFVLIRYINWNKCEKLSKAITYISATSFGVYLLHKYPLYVICYLFPVNEFAISWKVVGTIGIYFISVIVVLVLKKIPIIKNIVP